MLATLNQSEMKIYTDDDFIVNNINTQNKSTSVKLDTLYNNYPSPINKNEKKYTYSTFLNKKKLINSNIITNKQDLLMISLSEFFFKDKNIYKILPILDGNSKLSLRIIDWFVTNYSKKYNTSYIINTENGKNKLGDTSLKVINANQIKQFIVYLNYKSQLKAYSKKQFDPFCRRERIVFYYDKKDKSKYIRTTVGQLNFFRWTIQNNILEYICENIKSIETDMNRSVRNIYKPNQTNSQRRKRKEISVSATKTVNKHDVKIIVEFN